MQKGLTFSELAARILTRTVRDGDCLIWQGAKTSNGKYGFVSITTADGKRTTIGVHVVIYLKPLWIDAGRLRD